MVAANHRFVTPRDVARVLFRHWRKMALFFCAAIALTLLVIALYPRSYSSEAKLLLRVGRESVALDPTATTGETIMLQKTQADEVNSALSILSSRTVLEHAVEKIGAARILEDLPSAPTDAPETSQSVGAIRQSLSRVSGLVSELMVTLHLSDPGTDLDMAVRKLQGGVTVWAPKESTVISVTYSAASPQLAHDVVEAVTNAFLEEHVRLSQSEGSLAFFSAQVESLHEELTAAQAELRDKKNAFKLTSSANRQSIQERTNDALRQQLYEMELQESELKSRYTDAYPPLKEIRRQREEAARLLTEVLAETKDKTPGAAGSEAISKKLASDINALNDQEYQLAQLERKVQLLDGKYGMHVEKLEQARVNDALGREQICNVKVAQAATLVGKPDSPKKPLLAALGLLVATCGAIGLAFLSESMDQTLRTTDQVESQLGLPVLLSIPERKRRRRAAKGAPTMAAAKSVNGHANDNGHDVQNGQDGRGRYRGLVRELMSNSGAGDRHARTIGVIGCESSKLHSQVAANLAIQAATSGVDPVLLIDADARRRRVTKRFHLNGSPGWREVLAGEADAESCIHRPKVSNLSVMSPGTPNGHVAEPMVRPAMGAVGQLNEIKQDYGLVVVDMPPAGDMDAQTPSTDWLDEMVLVVDAERTRIQAAKRAKDSLQRAGVHVTGVVLANRREHIPRWLYQRL
jgi:polysaccharide biosynthesis transport protein